ncbi:PREDICTED: mucin-17 isoform X2 [Ipomoea nil]|uniref:mucin-17 isoform X2 n=1 Tax=Ipomoea nil TaxID=35883 RepID=UPI000900F04E|nr:PREDICTED: mucin-17 isoform X2 [Ipomoea nil]
MPPSPAMRRSPGREFKTENHKRGRSLESSIAFREKDDDLALFNEVQSRERENFLLDTKDDFDDICSTKFRYFSDYKLGISIPARGESSELLNAEGDKNDYDWLLTPPDTPLFPSLDDETPQANVAQRGRPRSQPISISRSSTMERSYRSSRGSASPNRLSPSPRSCNNTNQTRGRPSSPSHSSPPPSLRHATPTRRPSPSPNKPSTPPPRSSTPTPRRLSTGSSATSAATRVRGTSPVKTNRGNSASPKIRAWQSNIPGFSLEAPPNLRTSLADRPTSYVRGSSPASRNGSRSARKSMSPARSVSSTYSHERDRVSFYSKGSVASSGDDDTESLQSIPITSSDPSGPRSSGTFQHNKAQGLTKKTTRVISSSSAPKRSFDLALRQTDQRKSPHNMFRPLLSSVPSSTFYSGKASAAHRTLGSRHSSVTTSSNASSDQCMSIAHDTEEVEQNQEDMNSERVQSLYHDAEEVFTLDSVDGKVDGSIVVDSELVVAEDFRPLEKEMIVAATSQVLSHETVVAQADALELLVICSKCYKSYPWSKSIEEDPKLCPDCKSLEAQPSLSSPLTKMMVSTDSPGVSTDIIEYGPVDTYETSQLSPKLSEVTCKGELKAGHLEEVYSYCENLCNESSWDLTSNKSIDQMHVEGGEHSLATHQVNSRSTICTSDCDTGYQQPRPLTDHPNAIVDVPEGAGISLLLKRSSSGKGHIVQNRTLSATSIAYDDLSYVRDSVSSMRSSIGHGSASASSSVDFGSTRQIEARIQRQSSGRKPDVETYRNEIYTKLQRSTSSLSATSSQAQQPLSLTTSSQDEAEVSASQTEKNTEVKNVDPEESSLNLCTEDKSESICRISSNPTSHTDEASAANFECSLSENGDNITNSEICEQECMDAKCGTEIEKDNLQSDGSSRDSADEVKKCALHTPTDNDITDPVEVEDSSNHEYEESTVVVEGQAGVKTRSLTLEEATDTILFCSSIVHNLAYKAADIAIGKENCILMDASRPMLTVVGKASPDRRDLWSRTTARRNSRSSQKVKQKLMDSESKPPLPSNTDSDEKTQKPMARIVGSPSKGDTMKPPPKLESKCNCTIM